MPVDNHLYNQNASGWWDENNFLHTLKTGLNPARFRYFEQLLRGKIPAPALPSVSMLDLGCGGGLLAEEFARLGLRVTGIDPSAASVNAAHRHALHSGLHINYLSGPGETLPFPDQQFQIVTCCDVLEHVSDLSATLRESARVLQPGGFFLFDTINRTIQSYFENIFIAQNFPVTSFFPPNTHDWRQFIPPTALTSQLEQNGLQVRHITGLGPGIHPLRVAIELIRRKTGQITYAELGRRLKFTTIDSISGSYIGWAEKARA
jgi:2-polyprenyl-6-hydroxyphenyl methylase/3-demethylubiquinone-9 3-methyltransferase